MAGIPKGDSNPGSAKKPIEYIPLEGSARHPIDLTSVDQSVSSTVQSYSRPDRQLLSFDQYLNSRRKEPPVPHRSQIPNPYEPPWSPSKLPNHDPSGVAPVRRAHDSQNRMEIIVPGQPRMTDRSKTQALKSATPRELKDHSINKAVPRIDDPEYRKVSNPDLRASTFFAYRENDSTFVDWKKTRYSDRSSRPSGSTQQNCNKNATGRSETRRDATPMVSTSLTNQSIPGASAKGGLAPVTSHARSSYRPIPAILPHNKPIERALQAPTRTFSPLSSFRSPMPPIPKPPIASTLARAWKAELKHIVDSKALVGQTQARKTKPLNRRSETVGVKITATKSLQGHATSSKDLKNAKDMTTRSSANPKQKLNVAADSPQAHFKAEEVNRTNKLCELYDVPLKGLGLRATKQIKRGETILAEKPFLTYPHSAEPQEIFEIFSSLPSERKKLLLSFTLRGRESGDGMSLQEKVADILGMNAIPIWIEGEISDDLDKMTLLEAKEKEKAQDEDAETDDEREGGKSNSMGIFATICRINHSCVPCAGWSWDTSVGKMCM
jgi:hypothetical protein